MGKKTLTSNPNRSSRTQNISTLQTSHVCEPELSSVDLPQQAPPPRCPPLPGTQPFLWRLLHRAGAGGDPSATNLKLVFLQPLLGNDNSAVYKILGSPFLSLPDFSETSALLLWLLLLPPCLLFCSYVAFERANASLSPVPWEGVWFLRFEALGTFWSSESNTFRGDVSRRIILGQLNLVPGTSAPCRTHLLYFWDGFFRGAGAG